MHSISLPLPCLDGLYTAGNGLFPHPGMGELEKERITVSVAGRVMAKRSFGKASFSHIQDSTGKIQLYFQKNTLGDAAYELVKKIDIGDIIGVSTSRKLRSLKKVRTD